ncbi:hypothetical protein DYB32_005783 [Aphanomyces invadans]|uniref:F5/8 type C domain-containing protein n=1 Tax=Aphanomyces invadans TaxID=157072 RepID=A0A3R6ZP20_9STRA|nr:hypothetical protein DYB32_005783 [Aphanomyces invadans]
MENEDSHAKFAVDGDDETRFASADSDPQWLEVDLGALHKISHVCIQWEAAYAATYDIQVSKDRLAWTTVASVADNRGDGWVKTKLPDSEDAHATFIRMYGHARGTTYGYSIYHFNVYGTKLTPSYKCCIVKWDLITTPAVHRIGAAGQYELYFHPEHAPGMGFRHDSDDSRPNAADATTDVPDDAIHELHGLETLVKSPAQTDGVDELRTLESTLWPTSRDTRHEWKEKLAVRPPQTSKDLDEALVGRVLQGKLVASDIVQKPKAISVFVSSTFTDTASERNLLIADVYPYLKRYAALLGLEFSASEMRWGIRDEASNSHQTSAICMAELARCQTSSLGLNYVLILGNKYGYRPFPNQIPLDEFEALVATMATSDADVVRHWFRINTNVIPPAMELQPSTLAAPGTWWPIFEQMQRAFRNVRHVVSDPHRQDLYNVSVTECEVMHGLLTAADAKTAAFVYHRIIPDIDSSHGKAGMYVDMAGRGQIDDEAQALLATLRDTKVKPKQHGAKEYTIPWGPEILPETHATYLTDFCDHFCSLMCESLLAASEQLNVAPDAVFNEVMHHALFCAQRSANFVGRADILSKVHAYLRSATVENRPFVLYGRGGAGKSAVVAKVAMKLTGGGGPAVAAGSGLAAVLTPRHDPVLVLRFLGTSLDSTDIRKLLTSICSQIHRNYSTTHGMSATIPPGLDDLIRHFHDLLALASETKPLVVILDSLDQLSSADNAHHLTWLPMSLPPHCKLVVSALDAADEGGNCLAKLRAQTPTDHLLELPVMTSADGLDMMTAWLAARNRALTPHQSRFLVDSFVQCPLPLYLHVAFTLALPWTSYTPVDTALLPPTIPDLLRHLFHKLCGVHGQLLVHHTAGYLTLAKRGLSRSELEDVLSLDDDVLNDVYQWWVPPIRRIPSLVVTRLLSDLDSYLVTHAADGGIPVLSWYHREFNVAARAICLGDDAVVTSLSANLAAFFASDYAHVAKPFVDKNGVPAGRAQRKVAPQELVLPGSSRGVQFNHRRVTELPSALIGAQDWPRVEYVVSDVEFLQASVALGAIADTLSDIRRAIQAMYAADVPPTILPQVAAFLSRDMFTLQRHPSSFYQVVMRHPKASFLRTTAAAKLTPPPQGYFQVVSTETPASSILASFMVGPASDGADGTVAVAFSPDSLKVAALSEPDCGQVVYLTVFDVVSNTVMWTVAEPDVKYDSVTWSVDGTSVIVGASASGELHLFSEAIGVRTKVLHAALKKKKKHRITSVVCVNATTIVTADRTSPELHVWENGTIHRTLKIQGHGEDDHNDSKKMTQILLSPDRQHMGVASYSGACSLSSDATMLAVNVDTYNGQGAQVFGKAFDHPKSLIMEYLDLLGSAMEVCGIEFHPNHPSILYVFNSSTQVYAFDVVSERRLAIYAAPGHSFGGNMSMSLDGTMIATLGQTNNVLLWNPASKPAPLGAAGRVETIALHPSGDAVAACHSCAEKTRVMDVKNPSMLVYEFVNTKNTSTACTRVVYNKGAGGDEGRYVAATTNTGAICVGEVNNDQVTTTFFDTFKYDSIDVALHPSGQFVAALGLDDQYHGHLRYIRRDDGTVVWEMAGMANEAVRMGGMALQMSRTGDLVACLASLDQLSVFDTTAGTMAFSIRVQGGVRCYRFTPSFDMVALCAGGGNLQVWRRDALESPVITLKPPHTDATNITGIAVLPDLNIVFSCAEDGHLIATSLTDGAVLGVYANAELQPIHGFDILPSRVPRLAFGDDLGRIVVLDWKGAT